MSNSTHLRVGIAGYGAVGKLRHRVINERTDMRVVAVCDQYFKGSSELEGGVRASDSYKTLLAERLDVVLVCVPNYLAPEVTIAGLESGRHVFCEKPPGRDLDDIARVIACERAHPALKLMYGFNHRYHDSVREALRLIRSGELGRLINLRGVYGKSQMIRFDADWRTQRALSGGGAIIIGPARIGDGAIIGAGSVVTHDVPAGAFAAGVPARVIRTSSGTG